MLKPMLARGELHMVGATTLDEYRKHIEKDAALERRFQPVFVGEPTVEDTISILRGLRERYEVHHGVRITDSALVAAAVLSQPLHQRPLPARQGDRPDRRGGLAPAHGDHQHARSRWTRSSGACAAGDRAQALQKEKDAASKERLEDRGDLANLKEEERRLRRSCRASARVAELMAVAGLHCLALPALGRRRESWSRSGALAQGASLLTRLRVSPSALSAPSVRTSTFRRRCPCCCSATRRLRLLV